MRAGFDKEDHTYTQRQLGLLRFVSSRPNGDDHPSYSGRSFDVTRAIPIDLDLLTGNSSLDRSEIEAALKGREEHLYDDYSLQQEIDEGLRAAS